MIEKLQAKPLDIYCYENSGNMDIHSLIQAIHESVKSNRIVCVRFYEKEVQETPQSARIYKTQIVTALTQAIMKEMPNEYDSAELSGYLDQSINYYSKHQNSRGKYWQIEIDVNRIGNSVDIKHK